MTDRFDAVVVGAGPAGASAAILLARAGWHVALVEKARFPRRKVCGECIAASNFALLDALGVGAAVRERAGAALKRVALMSAARTLVAPLPAADDASTPWGRALGRELLDTLLVEQARRSGAVVLQPWSVQAIAGEAGRFRCTVRADDAGDAADAGNAADAGDAADPADPAGGGTGRAARRELEAPLVVAAHGSWEPLPFERAAVRRARRPGRLLAFKANFSGARFDADLLPVLAFDGGYGGMVIADAGVATLACCIRQDRLDACRSAAPGQRAGDVVERYLKAQVEGVAQGLDGATRIGAWLSTGPIRPGARIGSSGAADHGVFRIGNAAGEAHPIVGEGISMALQSAALLVELIAPERRSIVDTARSAETQARLLQRHAAGWRRHFSQRLAVAAAFANLAMRPAAVAAAWPLLARWPGLLTQGARWSGKTRSAVDGQAIAMRAMTLPSGPRRGG